MNILGKNNMKIVALLFFLLQSGSLYCGACFSALNSAVIFPDPVVIDEILRAYGDGSEQKQRPKRVEAPEQLKQFLSREEIIAALRKEKEKRQEEEKKKEEYD